MEDLPLGALASCASVSRRWSPAAIRRLWRDLKSPLPLLELLAPLYMTEAGSGVFTSRTWVRTPIVYGAKNSNILLRHSNLVNWQRRTGKFSMTTHVE